MSKRIDAVREMVDSWENGLESPNTEVNEVYYLGHICACLTRSVLLLVEILDKATEEGGSDE